VARKSSQVRQKSEVEQSRGKDVREECGTPRGKCAAKGGMRATEGDFRRFLS